MNRKISGGAYKITFDEKNLRFFLLSQRSVRVFDAKTQDKIACLKDIANPNQIVISHKNGIIIVKSTVGQFAFYAVEDFSFIGKLKIKGCHNTDENFYYDEEENIIYGIYNHGRAVNQSVYGVSPTKLQYFTIPLCKMKREVKEDEKPVTRYKFYKYCNGDFYMICNFYNVGKNARIYECSYGKYKKEANMLVLKEKYLSTREKYLELIDITEKDNILQIDEFCKSIKNRLSFLRFYRNNHGLFLITDSGVYHQQPNGTFEEVYRAKYTSDYAEFCGKRYICTWDWCLVQDIKI